MINETAYLSLNSVEKGQFNNEYAISVFNSRNYMTSGFFPASSIKDNKLEVKIIQETKDLYMLEVPGRFLNGKEEAGRGCYITVKKDQVSFD